MEKTAKDLAREERARKAEEKMAAGKQPSPPELSALHAMRERERITAGDKLIRECPKKILRDRTGIRDPSLNNLAERYGVPCRGDTVNLWKILERLFKLPNEFRRKGMRRISPEEATILNEEGDDEQWMLLLAREKFYKERDARFERHSSLLPRDLVHDAHTQWAARLRSAGHLLAKRFGNEAQTILSDALDDCARVISDVIGGFDDSTLDNDGGRVSSGTDDGKPGGTGAGPAHESPSEAADETRVRGDDDSDT